MKDNYEKDLVKQELLEIEKEEKRLRNKTKYNWILFIVVFNLLCSSLAIKNLEKNKEQKELSNEDAFASSYEEYVKPEYKLPEGYTLVTINGKIVGVKDDAIIEPYYIAPEGYVLENIGGSFVCVRKTTTNDDEKKLSLSK